MTLWFGFRVRQGADIVVNFEDRDTYEWKKKVLKKVYECIARYGTISYDFERNEERRYYALDTTVPV